MCTVQTKLAEKGALGAGRSIARYTLVITAALGLAPGLLACSDSDDGGVDNVAVPAGCTAKIAGDHYIGGLLPYTGPWPVGAGMERAIIQALGEVNAGGGIGGPTVGVVVCDTEGNKGVGTALMDVLGRTKNLGAVIGPARSVVVLGEGAEDTAVAKSAVDSKTLLVSPGATSPLVSRLDDDGFVFRTTVSDAVQGVILAKIAAREGFKKVLVIQTANDPYTQGIREVFVEAFTDSASGRSVEVETFSPDEANYAATLVDAALAMGPDAILMSMFVDTGSLIMKEAAARSWPQGNPAWLLPDGMREGLAEQLPSSAVLAKILGTLPAAPTGARFDAFSKAHRALFSGDPESFAAHAYDAAYLIAAAMTLADDPTDGAQLKTTILKAQPAAGETAKQFGPTEWAEMLDELQTSGRVDYEGASGAVDFDSNGDVSSSIEEWRIKDGTVESVGCWTAEGAEC